MVILVVQLFFLRDLQTRQSEMSTNSGIVIY